MFVPNIQRRRLISASTNHTDFPSLQGQILIAMPQMEDPRFHQAVVLVLEHDAKGAMGLIINRPLEDITFAELLEQVGPKESDADEDNDDIAEPDVDMPICFGGPVEIGRGFILHSTDVMFSNSQKLHDALAITTSLDMLTAIAGGRGPHKALLALGYAGWSAGQLETELQDNAWLNAPFAPELLFHPVTEEIWEKALASVGVSPGNLSASSGHA